MRYALGLLLVQLVVVQLARAQSASQLDEVARAASVMVDGDVCQRIVTDRALKNLLKVDNAIHSWHRTTTM